MWKHCEFAILIIHVGVLDIDRQEPLSKDHKIHPAEESVENDETEDDFSDEVNPVTVVHSVGSFHQDTNGHMEYSHDN